MEFWNSEENVISWGIATLEESKAKRACCALWKFPRARGHNFDFVETLSGGEVLRRISRGKVKNLAKNLRGFQKTQSGFFFWNYRAQLNFLQIEFSQQKVEKLFSLEFLKVNKSKNSRVFLPEKYILNPPIPCWDFFGIASYHW